MSSLFAQCLGGGFISDASDDEPDHRGHELNNLPGGALPHPRTTSDTASGPQRASGVDQSVYTKLEQNGAPVTRVDDWRAFQVFKRKSTDKTISYKKRRRQAGGAKTDAQRLKLLGDHIEEMNDRRLREFAFLQHAFQRVIPDNYFENPEDREKLVCDLGYTQNEWTHVCVEVNEHKLPDTPQPPNLSRRYGKNIWLTVKEVEDLMNAVEVTVKKLKDMVEGVMKKDSQVKEVLMAFWQNLEKEALEHKAEVEAMKNRDKSKQ